VGGDNGPGILECKTSGYFAAKAWEEGVPEWYQIQVLHQLAVTDRAWADVAVLIAGQAFAIHRIERDEALISQLIELERRFWQQVETDQRPETDGSASCRHAINCLFPTDFGVVLDFQADDELNALFTKLVDARGLAKEAAGEEERIRQQIQAAMGEATSALFCHGSVRWKRCRDRMRFNTATFEADHPELAKQYQVVTPGSRRFTVSTSE